MGSASSHPRQSDRLGSARKRLASALPAGRSLPRTVMTRAKLSQVIGRNRTYLSDFPSGRKSSLGAADIPLIEDALQMPRGWLLFGEHA